MQKLISLQMKKLELDLRNLLKRENSLVDIVVFGSALKSKEKPNDVDICIVLRDKNYKKSEDLIYEVVQLGRKHNVNVHCEPLVIDDMWKQKLLLTLMHEGYSVMHDDFISKSLGYESNVLFSYLLEGMSASDKVRFSYALYGRNKGEGLLFELNGETVGKGSFIVQVGKSEIVRRFMKQWNISFKERLIINIK